MAFLAGETITAGRLNRLQPRVFWAQASGSVPASSTNVDVPGVTVPITTTTANAQVCVEWFTDFDLTGATTAVGTSRAVVGAANSPALAQFAAEVATDRGTPGNSWVTTVAAASTFTVKIQATTPASMTVQTNTTMKVTVIESA